MVHENTDVHHLVSAPVVVGVDGSMAAATALDWAGHLAARRGRELRIVHAMDLAAGAGCTAETTHGRHRC